MTTLMLVRGTDEFDREKFRFKIGRAYTVLDEGEMRGRSYRWHRYRVNVEVEGPRDTQSYGAVYNCDYTGSAVDCENDKRPNSREVAECVAQEIMSAYTDPVGFMELVFMEPPTDTAFVKTIWELLKFASDEGPGLEQFLPEKWWEEEALIDLFVEEVKGE